MSNTAWRSDATPLAVTAGEPAGIGPDLVVRLAQERLAGGIVADIEHDAGEQGRRGNMLPGVFRPASSLTAQMES